MCLDLGVSLPIERLASFEPMDQRPLDLRMKRIEGGLRPRGAELGGREGSAGSAAAPAGGRDCLRCAPGGPWGNGSPEVRRDSEPWRGAGTEGERRATAPQPPAPAMPTSAQAGTKGTRDEDRGGWKAGMDKCKIALPPRKRPYPMMVEEQAVIPSKTSHVEASVASQIDRQQPVRLKTEREESFEYCGRQEQFLAAPFVNANGYPYLEPIYMSIGLHQPPYYPGASKSYLSSSIPICPVPTHPISVGALPAFHPPPCPLLCPREDIVASDIAMATRQDEDGDTPLHIAVVQEDVAMVQKLIQLLLLGKKDLDIYNNLRQTPLHLAIITKHRSIAGQLVTNGASRLLLDRNGQTAVHLACEHSSLECLRSLLGSGRENIDLEIRNYEGYTPLHVAVNSRHKKIVSHLLDRGADVDAVDIKSGRTPLIHAVENNCMDMVLLLLQHGANVNLQTYSGNTALHSASGRGLMEVVKALLKSGADSSVKNCHNDTSLMVAKNKKVIDILRGKASRSPAQPLPSQRAANTTKSCESSSSNSNSPLPTLNGLNSPSPSVHHAKSPQYLMPPSASSSSQRSPGNQSPDSLPSSCPRSPHSARSHPGTPRPEAQDPGPEEMSLNGQEDRPSTTCLRYPREKTELSIQGTPSRLGSPTHTPPKHHLGHCPLGQPFPQVFYQRPVGHPLHPRGGFPLSPFHDRHPSTDGSFLNFLAGHPPVPPNPGFAAHPSLKERLPSPLQTKHFPDSLQTQPHHQGRPSHRNSDRSDVSMLSANSVDRGES
ncbi:NF-kappa-B inhibitor epsilon-like [Heptranchias perlo]|uniref:NF-kappa-B inhibitor epsilon-like n=1 Tax=Heptranchias perlo TaxID=212740 RepID=UPI003559992B